MDAEKELTGPPPSCMGVVHKKTARLYSLSDYLPALEREAVAGAVAATDTLPEASQETALSALDKVVSARVLGIRRARNDRQRRTIIGARVNREFAAVCKWAAESQGLSTTEWCRRALEAALAAFPPPARHQAPPPSWDDLDDDEPLDGCPLL